MFTEYVAGFLFRHEGESVALIKKNKPEWQRDRLNGVGGKVELGETPVEAMTREFREETGAHVPELCWDKFCQLQTNGVLIHFFRSNLGDGVELRQTTDEHVDWYLVRALNFPAVCKGNVLPNLRWLIPMAKDPCDPFADVTCK